MKDYSLNIESFASGSAAVGYFKSNNIKFTVGYGAENYWGYDPATKALRIFGSGATADYMSAASTPWNGLSSEVKHIVIDEGITRLGNFSFRSFTSLEDVTFGDPDITFGYYVFPAGFKAVDPHTAVVPELVYKTDSSVQLKELEGYEYRMGTGVWQSSPLFEGLNEGASYTFTQRIAENPVYAPSEISETLSVTTVLRPSAPTLASVEGTTVTLNTAQGVEYSLSGEEWQTSPVFENVPTDIILEFYARTAATDISEESKPSAAKKVLIVGEPKVYSFLDGVLTFVENKNVPYEYSTDGVAWQTSPTFEDVPPIDILVFQRAASGVDASVYYLNEGAATFHSTHTEGEAERVDLSRIGQGVFEYVRCSECGAIVGKRVIEEPVGPVIFVANESRGKGDGSTPEDAMGNAADYDVYSSTNQVGKTALGRAYAKLKATGGYIVVVDELVIDWADANRTNAPAEYTLGDTADTNRYIITSVFGGVDYREDGAKLVIDQTKNPALGIRFRMPVTLENLTVDYKYNNGNNWYGNNSSVETKPTAFIAFWGKGGVVGEGVVCNSVPSGGAVEDAKLSLIAGDRFLSFENASLTVKSGSWYIVTGTHGMNTTYPGTVSGKIEINVEGGDIEYLYGTGAPNTTYGKYSSVGESAVINVTGGQVGKAIGTVNPGEDRAKYTINYNSDYVKTSDISAFGNVNKTGGKEITSVALFKLPDKTTFKIGDALDAEGLTLKVTYLDIPEEYVTSGFEISGFDSSSAGSKRVKVAYEGYEFYFNVEVTLLTQEAPSAPTVLLKTDSSVTLRAYTGYEYSVDGVNWRTNNVFTGLLPNTKYSFRQRKAATDIALASPSSVITEATTDRRVLSGSVRVTGEASLGSTVTAEANITPVSATFTYQWYRGGELIPGADGAEYLIDYLDIGKKIYVVISGTDAYTGNLVSGEVEAFQTTDGETPVISAEGVSAVRGTEFALELTLTGNTGMNVLALSPVLPDGVTLVRAENGEIFGSLESGKTLVFEAGGLDNVTASGKLATLYFKLDEGVSAGECRIGFEIVECVDGAEKIVGVRSNGVYVRITEALYGDVNGDGEITAVDIVRLKKYFAEYDPISDASAVVIGSGADANGDGNITALDVIRLKKYLAAYDPKTGVSTVRLGPAA